MKHIVVSKFHFDRGEEVLMNKYLEVARNMLIPALRSQTCQDFTWGIICHSFHIEYLKNELDFPFVSFENMQDCKNQIINYPLQTRHDMDDWMREDYIEKIQAEAKGDTKLIQARPRKVKYPSMEEKQLLKFNSTRTSMFLTLYQTEFKNTVFDQKHGQMCKVIPNVKTLPDNLVKWIQHPNTISQIKSKRTITGLYSNIKKQR